MAETEGTKQRKRAYALDLTPEEIRYLIAFLSGAATEQLRWALDEIETDRATANSAPEVLTDHAFRSLNGAGQCVVIVGPLNSGQACGLPPEAHQQPTATAPYRPEVPDA